ncbi:low affinity immunoglobulin gamma Fc region receptor II-like [Thunnus albacares]|uniref:low affinity immunoglobulin gamma Fc region receptor II-like n=1 Tax=Thunnus albacares TaxID=8236 RepID=UPI001CF7101A|nr:low affinity immunoglobulin gamma Fc region receptor II-like [Thunnus albacares]
MITCCQIKFTTSAANGGTLLGHAVSYRARLKHGRQCESGRKTCTGRGSSYIHYIQLHFCLMLRQQQDSMEVTAFCIRLSVFILLNVDVQNSDAAFRIIPTKLQLFQYEPVSFRCEGLDDSSQLRGIRDTEKFISECNITSTSTLSYTIQKAYPADSGEYWCETKEGKKSNRVNITITVGSVILESSVVPVMEGDTVTLRCRNKTTSSHLTADFYKNGLFMRSSSTGEITIHSVSKSDEGFYKCNISDVGESPESRLTVRALDRETFPSSDHSFYVLLLLRTVFTIVMVVLLLLLVGLLHCGKLRVTQK